MTYIEWRDELESYLTGLSESERKKVFAYYAEMYADRRERGESEKSIIIGFGAPYDVAQGILSDGSREEEKETAAPAAPDPLVVTAENVEISGDITEKKDNGKNKYSAVKLAILWLIITCFMCLQFAWAFGQLANAVYSFRSDDGYTGIAAIGYFIMHMGLAVISAGLCAFFEGKLKAAIKQRKDERNEKEKLD